ncbi:MAG: VWA domain-containing protein [Pseudomonadota bacterium]
MSTPPIPELDAGLLARRQLHVIFALDCSGSMRGDRMASLNYAMRTAIPELKTVAEDNPEVDVFVRVLRFDTAARWHIETPCPIAELVWEDLTAGGETAMGAALELMAEALSAESAPRQLPPVIVLTSDGYPTDDVETGLANFFAQAAGRAATRLAIAIGSNADLETLEAFMDADEHLRPLRANNAPDLVNSIKWATTAPVKATSSPTNAPSAEAQLANDLPELTADSDMVW